MLPHTQRRLLYAVLLILLSVGTFSAVAKNNIPSLFNVITSKVEKQDEIVAPKEVTTSYTKILSTAASAPLFTTIIQGADEEVACRLSKYYDILLHNSKYFPNI